MSVCGNKPIMSALRTTAQCLYFDQWLEFLTLAQYATSVTLSEEDKQCVYNDYLFNALSKCKAL